MSLSIDVIRMLEGCRERKKEKRKFLPKQVDTVKLTIKRVVAIQNPNSLTLAHALIESIISKFFLSKFRRHEWYNFDVVNMENSNQTRHLKMLIIKSVQFKKNYLFTLCYSPHGGGGDQSQSRPGTPNRYPKDYQNLFPKSETIYQTCVQQMLIM